MGFRGCPEQRLLSKVALFCFLSLCVFAFLLVMAGNHSTPACLEITRWRTASNSKIWRRYDAVNTLRGVGRRRRLLGPGSQPPRCTSKCSGCTPCRAVHVPVPPMAPAEAVEYYPEAWWCQCGGRLYVP